MQPIRSVSIAGAGNVATHLGSALLEAGIQIDFCWNRTPEKAEELASFLQTKATENLTDLQQSELIICCLSDDALMNYIPLLSSFAPVAATSGTVDVCSMEHLHPVSVVYPLQTFTKGRGIAMEKVPFFVESSDPELERALLEFAARISKEVHLLSWEKRQHLHVAAVLVNNFANHLATIAQEHLTAVALPFNWLLPLLEETVAKLKDQPAFTAQTGPAKRNDQTTIQRHLELLKEEDKAVYMALTSSILKHHQHDQL